MRELGDIHEPGPGWMPYKNLGIAADVPGYIPAHHEALSYDFDVCDAEDLMTTAVLSTRRPERTVTSFPASKVSRAPKPPKLWRQRLRPEGVAAQAFP